MDQRAARRLVCLAAAAYLRDSDDDLLTTDSMTGEQFSDADLVRIEDARRELWGRLEWRGKGLEGHQIIAKLRREDRAAAPAQAEGAPWRADLQIKEGE